MEGMELLNREKSNEKGNKGKMMKAHAHLFCLAVGSSKILSRDLKILFTNVSINTRHKLQVPIRSNHAFFLFFFWWAFSFCLLHKILPFSFFCCFHLWVSYFIFFLSSLIFLALGCNLVLCLQRRTTLGIVEKLERGEGWWPLVYC